jgi:L-lactate dehydrogenase
MFAANFRILLYFQVQGHHGVEQDVFLSVPCVLGECGIVSMVALTLSEKEADLLRKSAETISAAQNSITW